MTTTMGILDGGADGRSDDVDYGLTLREAHFMRRVVTDKATHAPRQRTVGLAAWDWTRGTRSGHMLVPIAQTRKMVFMNGRATRHMEDWLPPSNALTVVYRASGGLSEFDDRAGDKTDLTVEARWTMMPPLGAEMARLLSRTLNLLSMVEQAF